MTKRFEQTIFRIWKFFVFAIVGTVVLGALGSLIATFLSEQMGIIEKFTSIITKYKADSYAISILLLAIVIVIPTITWFFRSLSFFYKKYMEKKRNRLFSKKLNYYLGNDPIGHLLKSEDKKSEGN